MFFLCFSNGILFRLKYLGILRLIVSLHFLVGVFQNIYIPSCRIHGKIDFQSYILQFIKGHLLFCGFSVLKIVEISIPCAEFYKSILAFLKSIGQFQRQSILLWNSDLFH